MHSSFFEKKIVRWTLIFAGSVFVGIGILGIFLPLLPTTIFFILASWCYARSSQKFYNKFSNNKFFGKYLNTKKEGTSLATKIFTISFLWIGISYSFFFATSSLVVRLILLVIALSVAIHIVLLPSRKK